MRNTFLLICWVLTAFTLVKADRSDPQVSIEMIYKRIIDFKVKEGDLSTPLQASINYYYAFAKGENAQILQLASPRILAYKSKVNDENKEKDYLHAPILHSTILEVVNYRDSVACVILEKENDLILHILTRYNEKWLDDGEDWAPGLQEAQDKFLTQKVPFYLNTIRKTAILERVSTDTLAFIRYLNQYGVAPKEYLLKKVRYHKLVAYGEIHGRKKSWELLRELIAFPDFSNYVGTIFIELSMDSQEAFDLFLTQPTKDPEIILDIFRKEDLVGWSDRGMYEFILDLWDVNQKRAENQKLRIIPVDISRPFYHPNVTKEMYDEYNRQGVRQRDLVMAKNMEDCLKNSSDPRNCLFIAGYMHTYRMPAHERRPGKPDPRNCISILSDRLAPDELFTILTHGPMVKNNGTVIGLVRKGLFDYVFTQQGYRSVAFDLKNSPFGAEPTEVVRDPYDLRTGTYQDCYDGYIFLQPLQEEEPRYFLHTELMTHAFFEEIKRRAAVVGEENYKLGKVMIKEATYEDVAPPANESVSPPATSGNRWNLPIAP